MCVRIIAGDLANVTHDFPEPRRGNDVKRGATLPVLISRDGRWDGSEGMAQAAAPAN